MDKTIYFYLTAIIIWAFHLILSVSPYEYLHEPISLDDYISAPRLLSIGVGEPEASEASEPIPDEPIEEIVEDYPDALGTPYDWPEWLGEELDDLGPYALDGEYEPVAETEPSGQLARIEYHLSIISGGVVLFICSLFTWYTIIKPLKRFIMF